MPSRPWVPKRIRELLDVPWLSMLTGQSIRKSSDGGVEAFTPLSSIESVYASVEEPEESIVPIGGLWLKLDIPNIDGGGASSEPTATFDGGDASSLNPTDIINGGVA